MASVEEIELPALPARGVVLFPHGTVAVAVVEEGLREVLKGDRTEPRVIAVVGSRESDGADVDAPNLHEIGTIGAVMRLTTVSDDASVVAFVHGLHRMRVIGEVQRRPYLVLRVRQLEDVVPPSDDPEYLALKRNIADLFDEIVSASPNLPSGIGAMVRNVEDASVRTDLIASFLPYLSRDAAQALLESLDVRKRMRRLTEELLKEHDYLKLRDKIQSEVSGNIGQAQRQFFLREQLKAIQRELGEADECERDVAELRDRLQKASLPEEADKEADRELSRLQHIPNASPEHAVARTYLDWLAALPWSHSSETNADLVHAEKILNEDHYGLERVKERILEFLAVHALKKTTKSPILCFVGPPGVGKTSLGKSIARATGRTFVRISLGGMHDEAEIRGHRRTYVGALPGQIIRGLRRAIRSSCSTRSTRSVKTSEEIPRTPCSKCSTRNRTSHFETTTWMCRSTSRKYSSSRRPMSSIPSLPRSAIAWKPSICRDTPRRKSFISHAFTSFRVRSNRMAFPLRRYDSWKRVSRPSFVATHERRVFADSSVQSHPSAESALDGWRPSQAASSSSLRTSSPSCSVFRSILWNRSWKSARKIPALP